MQNDTTNFNGNAMVTVNIQHLAMGSLTTAQGDTTLSYTGGVSQVASDLCALTMGNAAADYASIYFIGIKDTRGLAIVHVQGNHVVMGGGARAYTTRVAYECSEACVGSAGGYLPILGALDRMKLYDKPQWGVDGNYTITLQGNTGLTDDETALLKKIEFCLQNNCRLFVKLGDDEKRKADDLRQSAKLASMLKAVDHLPPTQRLEANVAFSTNAMACAALMPLMRIVAHHDSLDNWGSSADNSVVVDWTSQHITTIK